MVAVAAVQSDERPQCAAQDMQPDSQRRGAVQKMRLLFLWQAGNAFEIQGNSIVQRASNLLERATLHAGKGPATLPNALDIVSVESTVATDQWQTFDLGLSCQHAVEWVAVVMRQPVYGERVRQADLQHLEAIHCDLLKQKGGKIGRRTQAAEAHLNGDLPCRNDAEPRRRPRIANERPRVFGESGIVRYPPEKRMRIKEDVHASKESRMSSGRRASKSDDMSIIPRALPGRRSGSVDSKGTRRATGLPALATMTSSPRRTRSSNLENVVFASWTLTVVLIIDPALPALDAA